MSSLRARLLTAAVAIPAVILFSWAATELRAPWILGILLAGVGLLAGWEYLELVGRLGAHPPKELFLTAIPVYLLVAGLWEGRYALVLGWAVVYLTVIYCFSRRGHVEGFWSSLAGIFGFLYIPGLLSFFYLLFRGGFFYFLHFLLIVWGYDTGAYLVGSLWGRHRLIPHISMAKTWEGVAGGLMLAVVGALLNPDLWGRGLLPHAVGLGIFVGSFVQLGDLFESLLKRAAGVKDSGRIFPGHGGMLDRIDGTLAAIPTYYFYLHFILHLI
ncbi:MAG TPA: hypothetical protein ENF77_06350 [Candidatus Acetothermia bacterium]|nr:hypothetical protein [Candidatus Acetothermia bacterium]